jgi:hypothetical protein
MSKKAIIISLIAMLVVAGGVVGALVLYKNPLASTFGTDPSVPLAADTSKDYGACTLLDNATILSALGVSSADLYGPNNMGRIYSHLGDESQTCVYSFVPGGTIDNGFHIENSLSVEVYVYKNQSTKDKVVIDPNYTPAVVTGVADSATFAGIKSDDPSASQYVLKAVSGLKTYTFTLTKPTDGNTFTDSSARTALETIAKSATYK